MRATTPVLIPEAESLESDRYRAVAAFLRAPRLPLQVALDLLGSPDLEHETRALLGDSETLLTAMRLTAPDLTDAAAAWLKGGASSRHLVIKLALTLVRMALKPTPVRLYAGLSPVKFSGEKTTIALTGEVARLKPDIAWLTNAARSIVLSPTRPFPEFLRLYSNQTIIERAGRVYALGEPVPERFPTPHYRQRSISLKLTPLIRSALSVAAAGIYSGVLRDTLVREIAEDSKTCETAIRRLIDATILITEFDHSLIGDPCEAILGAVGRNATDTEYNELLRLVEQLRGFGADPHSWRYADVTDVMATMQKRESTSHSCLRTNLLYDISGELSSEIASAAETYAAIQFSISDPWSSAELAELIMARFDGSTRLVPLLEIISPEFGFNVRYPVSEHWRATGDAHENERRSIKQSALAEIYSRAIASRSIEVELSQFDLERLKAPRHGRAPRNCDVGIVVCARSREDIDSGNFLVVASDLVCTTLAGASVRRFVGDISDSVFCCLNAGDQQEQIIEAEVLTRPILEEALNVVTRTTSAEYCIPIGTAPPEDKRCLRLDHLFVGVTASGRLYLWSSELNAVIRPIQSHVFDTTSYGPDLARLLLGISNDGLHSGAGLHWEGLTHLAFLPRIRYQRYVLSRARWRLDMEPEGGDIRERIRHFRESYMMPRYVCLFRDSYRGVPFDLDGPPAYDWIRETLRTHKTSGPLIFEESLPSPEDTWLTDANGRLFSCDITVSLTSARRYEHYSTSVAVSPETPRLFAPGGGWVYLKLYCGTHRAQDRLLDALSDVIRESQSIASFISWHFLRYRDPLEHIRLRLHFSTHEARTLDKILTVVRQLVARGYISNVALESYEPEYERYGGIESMPCVEAIFSESSSLALDHLIDGLRLPYGEIARMADAIVAFDTLALRWVNESSLCEYMYTRFKRPGRLSAEERLLLRDVTRRLHAGRIRYMGGPQNRSVPVLTPQIWDSILHMHYNRFGVPTEREDNARRIQWRAYQSLSFLMQHNATTK